MARRTFCAVLLAASALCSGADTATLGSSVLCTGCVVASGGLRLLSVRVERHNTAQALTSLAPSHSLSPTQARTRTPSGRVTGEPAGEAPLLPPVLALACLWAQPLVSTL